MEFAVAVAGHITNEICKEIIGGKDDDTSQVGK
jgi:hypothetical protein